MKPRYIKLTPTVFSYKLWYFTRAKESLFDLSKIDLYMYSLIVAEALK